MDARVEAVAAERALGVQLSTQPDTPVSGRVSPPCLMRIFSAPDTHETVVVMRGEIDYDCEEACQSSLTHALSGSARGIAIDLSKVTFFACSSVKILLAVRRLALQQGKTISLRATSPAAHRVLELSGILHHFATTPAPPP